MVGHYLLLCLFGFSASFVSVTVAHEAIIGGELVNNITQFPYQVSVYLLNQAYTCGGGIIDNEHILTAAHCIMSSRHEFLSPIITVRAGTTNNNKTDTGTVDVRVRQIFFPMEFRSVAQKDVDDIAVLRVYPLGLAMTNFRKLELPENNRIHYKGKIASVAGFGANTYRRVNQRLEGVSDGRLRYAWAHVDSDRGKQIYAAISAVSVSIWGHGTCTGDPGSPLVFRDRFVIGILSRNSIFCDEGHNNPAIYTRVAYYRKMIISAVNGKSRSGMGSIQVSP